MKGYLLEYIAALFWQFALSIKIFREKGFDIIHACNPPDNIFLVGLFYKVFFRKKFIFDHHDINPELYIAKFGKKDLFYRIMLLLEKLTFKTADISLATNESYKKIAMERGGMSQENVYIVRSGPDLSRAKRVQPNEKWKNSRKFLVGYVGVMGAQEGLDYLLKGVAHLVHELKRKDVQFVLVGGGTKLGQLKTLSEALRVDEHVTFTGRVPDETLMEVLSTADVCVNPDVVNDMNDKSTMNKIMEYMAVGKPIVQFEMTEGRYSAQEASLYAEPNNPVSLIEKVLEILNNPDMGKKMGEYGKERVVTQLQWKHEIPKLLSAYKAICPH
jgi:glycosyltransferase involved in cell wall biosynthesis